jgi:hypothetical protein
MRGTIMKAPQAAANRKARRDETTRVIVARQRSDRDAAVRAAAFRVEYEKVRGDLSDTLAVIASVGYWR